MFLLKLWIFSCVFTEQDLTVFPAAVDLPVLVLHDRTRLLPLPDFQSSIRCQAEGKWSRIVSKWFDVIHLHPQKLSVESDNFLSAWKWSLVFVPCFEVWVLICSWNPDTLYRLQLSAVRAPGKDDLLLCSCVACQVNVCRRFTCCSGSS